MGCRGRGWVQKFKLFEPGVHSNIHFTSFGSVDYISFYNKVEFQFGGMMAKGWDLPCRKFTTSNPINVMLINTVRSGCLATYEKFSCGFFKG